VTTEARRTWICLVVLALFTCTFFFPVLFLNQAMFPSSVLAGDAVWNPAAAGWHDPLNDQLFDQVVQFYPWHVLTSQAFAQGIMPEWNPYDGLGEPLLGAMQPAVFDPLNLLALLFGPARATGIRAALCLFLAAAGMLLYLCSLRLGHTASLFGAVAFGYCQFNVVAAGYSKGMVVIWLPWLLLALDTVMVCPAPWWTAALAACWGMSLLGGHIESNIQMALLAGAYTAWRLVGVLHRHDAPRAMRSAVRVGAGLALGTGLAAVQLLPVLVYLPQTIAAAVRTATAGVTLSTVLGAPGQWLTIVATLLPDIFGNPTRTGYSINYGEAACFFGVTATVLLLAAGKETFRRPHAVFFLCALIATAGLAFQLPLISVLGQIFPLSITLIGRLRLEYTFCATVLAATVLHDLGQRADAVVLAATLWRGIRRWVLLCAGPLLILVSITVGLIADPAMKQAIDLQTFLPLAWLAAITLLVVALRRGRLSRQTFLLLLLTVQAIDVFTMGFVINPRVPLSHVAPITPVISYLRIHAQGYRVAGVDAAVPNVLSAFDIADIALYDPAAPASYRTLVRAWLGRDLDAEAHTNLRLTADDLPALQLPLLNALGVKYLVAGESLTLPAGDRWQVRRFGAVDLYENMQALPFAHIVQQVQCLPTPGAVLRAATSRTFQPAMEALAVCTLGMLRAFARLPARSAGRVLRTEARGLNGTDVLVQIARPAVVVLSQQDLPGWTVSDGHTSYPIVNCDGALQCVVVPGGRLLLHVRYEAPGLRLGLAVTAIGILCGALLIAVGISRSAGVRNGGRGWATSLHRTSLALALRCKPRWCHVLRLGAGALRTRHPLPAPRPRSTKWSDSERSPSALPATGP
jgi:hypothetical protein